jgi:hypothetical protein
MPLAIAHCHGAKNAAAASAACIDRDQSINSLDIAGSCRVLCTPPQMIRQPFSFLFLSLSRCQSGTPVLSSLVDTGSQLGETWF